MELKDISVRTSAQKTEAEDINYSCDTATLQELIDSSPIKHGGQYIRVCTGGVSYVSVNGIYICLTGHKRPIDRFDMTDQECLEVYDKLGKTIVNLYVNDDHTKLEIET